VILEISTHNPFSGKAMTKQNGIPKTRQLASHERQEAIRKAVQTCSGIPLLSRIVTQDDVHRLTDLFADPSLSAPIYTLPTVINHDTIAAFIDKHQQEQQRGEGLLMINEDDNGQAAGYYDVQVWPQWAACELGGGLRSDRQSSGQGGAGAVTAFNWLFDDLGVDLICETAALDNIRTARLLERIGFNYMGEVESVLPEGGVRPSRYWEMTRQDWMEQLSKHATN
jgi:RimJ/RimL family protein N-acetyltransferase